MKLRVSYFGGEYWVIERERRWLFFRWWSSLHKAIIFEDNQGLSRRRAPFLLRSFEEACERASQLLEPGALAAHEAEQDAAWAKAQLGWHKTNQERKRVVEISPSGDTR